MKFQLSNIRLKWEFPIILKYLSFPFIDDSNVSTWGPNENLVDYNVRTIHFDRRKQRINIKSTYIFQLSFK